MKRSGIVLEQHFLHEKTADHIVGIEEFMTEIKRSNEDILRLYPAKDMKAAIQAKMGGKKRVLPFVVRHHLSGVRLLSYAAVLCCVLFVSVVSLRGGLFTTDQIALSERVKGSGPRLMVYKKDGNAAVLLGANEKVSANDMLQIRYIAAGDAYGAIISVDGTGTVTQHFPDSGDKTVLLDNGGEVSLDFSYRLDSAPNFERFIFITGKKALSLAKLKKEISSTAGSSETGDFDITGILPAGSRAFDVLLLK